MDESALAFNYDRRVMYSQFTKFRDNRRDLTHPLNGVPSTNEWGISQWCLILLFKWTIIQCRLNN